MKQEIIAQNPRPLKELYTTATSFRCAIWCKKKGFYTCATVPIYGWCSALK